MTISNSLSSISLALLLVAPVGAQQPKCAPVPPGLTARFSFDEPGTSAPTATRVPGKVGQALAFDGLKQFHQIPSSPALNFGTSDFTVEFWLRTSNALRTRNILDKRDDALRGYAVFIERKGHLGFQVAAGESSWVSIADFKNASADGRWHHVAGVARRLPAQPPKIYVDGELRAAAGFKNTPFDSVDNSAPLWIARHHRNAIVERDDYFWEGAVDELALYRRALTPEQIRAIFQAGRAGKCR